MGKTLVKIDGRVSEIAQIWKQRRWLNFFLLVFHIHQQEVRALILDEA